MKKTLLSKGIFLILILFFVIGILRLNDLSIYSDSTRYVIWGTSLAHGKGFVDSTQPIPESYVVNAPLFSVILSPALLIFPYSLTVAKILTLLFGCLALYLLYRWLRLHFSEGISLLITAIVACAPFMIVLSTEVLSETLFLCFVFGILLLINRHLSNSLSKGEKILTLCLIAFLPLLREIGFALVLAIAIVLFSERQFKNSAIVLVAALVPIILWYIRNKTVGIPAESQAPNTNLMFQHFVTSEDSPIVVEFWQRLMINGKQYLILLAGLVFFTFPSNLILEPSSLQNAITSLIQNHGTLILILTIPLLLIGIREDWKTSNGKIRIIFLFFYSCILLIYPMLDPRFVFPVLPFLLFLMAIGLKVIFESLHFAPILRRIVTAIILLLFIPNVCSSAEILKSNILYTRRPDSLEVHKTSYQSYAYYTTPWKLVGKWIQSNVPAGSVVVTPYKEIALFAPKVKFLEINRGVPVPQYESSLRNFQATYLLAPIVISDITDYQIQMMESRRFSYKLLDKKSRIAMYQINSKPSSEGFYTLFSSPSSAKDLPDSLFEALRKDIHIEKYIEARNALNNLERIYPRQADMQYQRVLIDAFASNDSSAQKELQALYSMPMSSPYVRPASFVVGTMESYLNTKSLKDDFTASENLFKISRFYWNFGYPTQAVRVMDEVLQRDPTHFLGLLWRLHYSIELGKPNPSYLTRLDSIDSGNILVQSFHRILRLRDSLSRAKTQTEKAELHGTLAQIYDEIGLPDEAIDHAEMSVADDPHSLKHWYNLAALYDKQRAPIAAFILYKKILTLDSSGTQARLALYRLQKGFDLR